MSSPQKILIATPLYPPEIGGPATYVKFLETNLPKDLFEIQVVHFGEVKHLPYIIRHIVFFAKVWKSAKDADIVYALDPLGVGLPTGLAAKLRGKKFMLRIAGDRAWETAVQKWGITESLDTFSASHFYGLRIRALKFGQTCTARLAWKIITPGNYLKKIVSNWGIAKDKIFPIYNAFSPLVMNETKEELRKNLLISGEVIMSAGRLVAWKGFEMLVRALPEMQEDFPNVKLYLAGDGPDKEKLTSLSQTLHLEDKVIFLGNLPKEKLMQYIKAADVFALNTFYEGFSHQLLEAMSQGTPVVTTTAGGNPEMIDTGVNGLLVTYNDSRAYSSVMSLLLKDKAYAKELAERGKEKAKTFSIERAIRELLEVIK
jgi:glycosyltransferase involved in cell wall biosynthesis